MYFTRTQMVLFCMGVVVGSVLGQMVARWLGWA